MKKKKSFEDWMKEVNIHLSKSGFDYRDLPDQPYYDWYDDGVSAKSAAARAKKRAFSYD